MFVSIMNAGRFVLYVTTKDSESWRLKDYETFLLAVDPFHHSRYRQR